MPRRPLDNLTALSALLLAAWVFLCVLSCIVPAGANTHPAPWKGGFALRDGELHVWSQAPASPRNKKSFPYAVLTLIPHWEWADVALRAGTRPTGQLWWDAKIPFWLVTAVLGFLPAWRLAARHWRTTRYRARVVRSLCHACGYDLRGCVNHTCPECGTVK